MSETTFKNIIGILPAPENDLPNWRKDGKTLQINEIFYSIEGEGLRVGQPTTFVRLSKCNLRCHFCDTDFNSYNEMIIKDIIIEVQRHSAKWVCLTGGEPLGQNIVPLCSELHKLGYKLHIETNGTVDPAPKLYNFIEHWTVSPKSATIASGLTHITELKYIVGKAFQEEIVAEGKAKYIYLQPETSKPQFIQKTLDILTRHPDWRMSFRTHKIINLP